MNQTNYYDLNCGEVGPSKRHVELHEVIVERGMEWEKAFEIYQKCDSNDPTQGFFLSNQVIFVIYQLID